MIHKIENDHVLEFVAFYHGQIYWNGVAADCHHDTREFFDHLYYINDQEYSSFQEFKSQATIEGLLFANLNEKLDVIDTIEGNPKRYYSDLTYFKKKFCIE